MKIHINPGDGNPIYRQIMNQVKYLVGSGRLKPGDSLPPIRNLAQDLLINPNTVARAYRELEAMGVLRTRQGSGTTVADRGSPLAREERERILGDHIDTLLAETAQLGFSFQELLQQVRARHKAMLSPEAAREQD